MNCTLVKTLTMLALLSCAGAQEIAAPTVPENIKAPAGERPVLVAHATGFQIYTCQAGAEAKPNWTFKEPQAELRDTQDRVVGRHYAGPTWQHNDGSQVTGKLVSKANAPDPDDVPWLLLTATAHSGTGTLSQVSTIQRVHTKGGQPPRSACTASNLNTVSKSSYVADYYFYEPAK